MNLIFSLQETELGLAVMIEGDLAHHAPDAVDDRFSMFAVATPIYHEHNKERQFNGGTAFWTLAEDRKFVSAGGRSVMDNVVKQNYDWRHCRPWRNFSDPESPGKLYFHADALRITTEIISHLVALLCCMCYMVYASTDRRGMQKQAMEGLNAMCKSAKKARAEWEKKVVADGFDYSDFDDSHYDMAGIEPPSLPKPKTSKHPTAGDGDKAAKKGRKA
jgi:hypothetical protein